MSRYALAMTRADVKADLAEMAHCFDIDPDTLQHYRDELIDAENICAHCTSVARCFRWKRERGKGDAPQLFCPNAELFSELATNPFWAIPGLRDWPADPAALPWQPLLESTEMEFPATPPKIASSQLKSFAKVATKIDRITQYWAPRIDSAADSYAADSLRHEADLEMTVAVAEADDITFGDFRMIYYMALSDCTIAEVIVHLLEQENSDRVAALA